MAHVGNTATDLGRDVAMPVEGLKAGVAAGLVGQNIVGRRRRYRRLNAAYQQALRYAEDVRALYQQMQRGIYQSLLGLARAASVAGLKPESIKAAKDFLAAWHLADKDRPELAEMRALSR